MHLKTQAIMSNPSQLDAFNHARGWYFWRDMPAYLIMSEPQPKERRLQPIPEAIYAFRLRID